MFGPQPFHHAPCVYPYLGLPKPYSPKSLYASLALGLLALLAQHTNIHKNNTYTNTPTHTLPAYNLQLPNLQPQVLHNTYTLTPTQIGIRPNTRVPQGKTAHKITNKTRATPYIKAEITSYLLTQRPRRKTFHTRERYF